MKKLCLALVLVGSIAVLPSVLAQQTPETNAPKTTKKTQSISHGDAMSHGDTTSADSAHAQKTTKVKKATPRPKKTSKTQQKTRSKANPSGSPQN
jgi:hypothetical protein